jgi:hypothetical protein
MLPGAPAPLRPDTPLASVLPLFHSRQQSGAWVRGCRRTTHLRAGGRLLLAGPDLGALLRRCEWIAVRSTGCLVAARAHDLIAWRTLRIITATPFLASLEQLHVLLPNLVIRGNRLTRPIGLAPPEETLAACLTTGVPVVASWVDYRR